MTRPELPHDPSYWIGSPRSTRARLLIWFAREKWSIEEVTNLLCGCISEQQMLGYGERNRRLDAGVVALSNRLVSEIAASRLQAVATKRYSGKTFVRSPAMLPLPGRRALKCRQIWRRHRPRVIGAIILKVATQRPNTRPYSGSSEISDNVLTQARCKALKKWQIKSELSKSSFQSRKRRCWTT